MYLVNQNQFIMKGEVGDSLSFFKTKYRNVMKKFKKTDLTLWFCYFVVTQVSRSVSLTKL